LGMKLLALLAGLRLHSPRGRGLYGFSAGLMVPMLLRGNPNRGVLRPATRSVASCAPTQEHGRDQAFGFAGRLAPAFAAGRGHDGAVGALLCGSAALGAK